MTGSSLKRATAGRRRRQKVTPGLVTLGSSVILAAYGAGWVQTRAFRAPPPVSQPSPSPLGLAASPPPFRATAQPNGLQPAATPDAVYREGRYVGTGESIHGAVTVAIVIFEGRIVSAEIVKCDTRYACSQIDELSVQAVERQSARLRYVSGATDSSRAYVKALEAALAKAAT